MNIFVWIGILFVISFLWAFFSLRREGKKPKEIKHAQEELAKEKILYKS